MCRERRSKTCCTCHHEVSCGVKNFNVWFSIEELFFFYFLLVKCIMSISPAAHRRSDSCFCVFCFGEVCPVGAEFPPLTQLFGFCRWEREEEEEEALSRLVRKPDTEHHSKSSSYSYSSRSRLQCGLGISKKCLFVRPSSLEMCCPKGLRGFSYTSLH